jgi:hypothetical protein
VSCEGKRVDSISVAASAPTVTGVRRIPIVSTIVRGFHVTTREVVIRRFLLLKEGDICTELRRAESERILRAQNFLAEATIAIRPSPNGGVVLDVRTTDEVAIVLGGSVVAKVSPVRAFMLGNSNIDGTTTYFAGSWRDGQGYRDGFGGRFQHQQLLGHPYVMDLEGERRSLGERWLAETSHPFYTDLQRLAWRLRSGSSSDYIAFPTDSQLDRAVRVDRRFIDLGGMVRIGPPGRLTLFGASLSGDEDAPAADPVIVGPTGLSNDPDPTLRNRYVGHRIARANMLWGVRDITFARSTGLDALTATQDVPTGFQLGTMFGRSLSVLGSRDNDIFLAGDLYVGAASSYSTFRLQIQGEGRRSNDRGAWDGILTSGRAAEYTKASDRNTIIGSLEWSGGWKQRIPFNLTFNDPIAGVRGFANSRLVGGQRIVGRAESRWVIGPATSFGDLGVAAFADAGKLLPGDVPFGSRSPLATSVGLSLLVAAPRHSARLWRMDVALAVHGNTVGHHLEIRFSGADNTKFFFREPTDVERTRELTVPSSVFKWP